MPTAWAYRTMHESAALLQLAQRLFQPLLLLAVGGPVTAPEGFLRLLPRVPRPLNEARQDTLHDRRRRHAGRRRPRGALLAASAPAEDALERQLERGLHRDRVAVDDDHAPQLRQGPSLLGGEVERHDVDQGLVDGDGEEGAAQHAAPLLVPERALLGDHGVLVDPRTDVAGAGHEP